ncbi:MAG: glycosyltransferase family 2 protein [Deltaproteobacteria bacterium]|nr:glycosyltransferase family 2 protein [Deltaproteobacteria bacterium]
MNLLLSVIVCTYNRSDLLMEALQSLTCQTAPLTAFEVLVVNNGSTDATQQIAEDFCERFENFHVVIEPQQGLSYARNRGFKEAKTPWVSYLDDDARARPDFAERIIHTVENFSFDCVGGVYLPWYKYGKPLWFRDEYGTNGRLLDETGVLHKGEISGGVSAFKKSVLEQLGGFPTSLGMTGNKIAYGEETLLQVRMRKKGFVIGFDPGLLVDHIMPLQKMTVRWLLKSAYRHGLACWDAYEQRPLWRRVFKRFLELGSFTFKNIFIYTPRLARHDYYFQNWIIDMLKPLSLNWGMIVSGIKKLSGKNVQHTPGPECR